MRAYSFDPVVRLFWEGSCRGNWHEGPRRIYDCLLDYVSDGEYTLSMSGVRHVFNAGSIIIVPPGTRSEGGLTSTRYAFRHCVHFSWTSEFIERKPPLQTPADEAFRRELAHPVPAAIAKHLPLWTHAEAGGFLARQMQVLLAALRKSDEHAHLLLWPVLRFLLSLHEAPTAGAVTVSASARTVLDLKSFIDAHYFEDIGYSEFRERTGLSQSYLCENFHNIVGMPPAEYLIDVRLQHARRLLREEKLSIKQIARTVGVRDANYFARLFRKRFAVTPSSYKTRNAE
jgi:AraC-like DNA-binding protein